MTSALHGRSLRHQHTSLMVDGGAPATEAATKLLGVLVLDGQPRLLRMLLLNLHDVVKFLSLVHKVGRDVESSVIEVLLVVLRSSLD